MNEWGLPDWKDATSYGNSSEWDWCRWRWEFYRRRADLRAYFDQYAEGAYQTRLHVGASTGSVEPALTPSQPGFTVPSDDLFGYAAIPNPRISDQPKWLLQLISKGPSPIDFYSGEHYKDGEISLERDSQTAIIFDIDQPLKLQIEQATAMLERSQKLKHGKLLQTRLHFKKWLEYLRILDAREAQASLTEIAAILAHTAGTPQTARDKLHQAQALCFKFGD